MEKLLQSITVPGSAVIGTGKAAGVGQPGKLPAAYRPDKENPISAYRNVAGCLRNDIKDYLWFIDSWNWSTYDYKTWPCADMSFPDLDRDKKYDVWPFKPDLDQPHWVDLNDMKDGIRRKVFTLGKREEYKTPGQYIGKDALKTAAQLEELVKGSNENNIKEAGFKDVDHVQYVIALTKEQIREAQAEIDKMAAGLQSQMNANVDAAKKGGLLDPVSGITMEDWAAANAKIAGGMSLPDVLKVLGIEKPLWDSVSAEWMSRMSQDTTFAISKVYGDAFVNPNMGKFASSGGAAAAGNNGAIDKVKNDFDLYIKIMSHQNMASAQGVDANAVLKQYGLTAGEWGTASMHWAPQMSTNLELIGKMTSLMDKYNAEFAMAKAGDDIEF